MTHKGASAVVEDAFADAKAQRAAERAASGGNTPAGRSRGVTPAASKPGTPAGSGGEGGGSTGTPPIGKKKKKLCVAVGASARAVC
jgi:elongation factor 3